MPRAAIAVVSVTWACWPARSHRPRPTVARRATKAAACLRASPRAPTDGPRAAGGPARGGRVAPRQLLHRPRPLHPPRDGRWTPSPRSSETTRIHRVGPLAQARRRPGAGSRIRGQVGLHRQGQEGPHDLDPVAPNDHGPVVDRAILGEDGREHLGLEPPPQDDPLVQVGGQPLVVLEEDQRPGPRAEEAGVRPRTTHRGPSRGSARVVPPPVGPGSPASGPRGLRCGRRRPGRGPRRAWPPG